MPGTVRARLGKILALAIRIWDLLSRCVPRSLTFVPSPSVLGDIQSCVFGNIELGGKRPSRSDCYSGMG